MGEAKRRGDLQQRIEQARQKRANKLAEEDLEADRQYAARQKVRAKANSGATGIRHSRRCRLRQCSLQQWAAYL